jgi:hypothetical protein
MTRLVFVSIAITLAACSKSGDAPAPAPAASAAPSAAPSAPAASASAASAPTGSSWSGKYTAAAGSFTVPDGGEWSGVKFRGDDSPRGLGDGTLSADVDAAGRVSGTLEGPLGPLKVNGDLAAKAFSAALVSATPGDGFSGFAVGALDGDHITGTMRLSLPRGNVIREASFTLDRKH